MPSKPTKRENRLNSEKEVSKRIDLFLLTKSVCDDSGLEWSIGLGAGTALVTALSIIIERGLSEEFLDLLRRTIIQAKTEGVFDSSWFNPAYFGNQESSDEPAAYVPEH